MKMNIGIQKEEGIDVELKEGKKIALSEVDADERLLSYEDRQVLLYIQEHGEDVQRVLEDGSKGRRFHIAFCRTLREMKRDGLDLYVATTEIMPHKSWLSAQTRREQPVTTELPDAKLYFHDALWSVPWDAIISERNGESKRLLEVVDLRNLKV